MLARGSRWGFCMHKSTSRVSMCMSRCLPAYYKSKFLKKNKIFLLFCHCAPQHAGACTCIRQPLGQVFVSLMTCRGWVCAASDIGDTNVWNGCHCCGQPGRLYTELTFMSRRAEAVAAGALHVCGLAAQMSLAAFCLQFGSAQGSNANGVCVGVAAINTLAKCCIAHRSQV